MIDSRIGLSRIGLSRIGHFCSSVFSRMLVCEFSRLPKRHSYTPFSTLETSHPALGWLNTAPKEHGSHVLNLRDIPFTNWLAECSRFIKHGIHVLHLGDIPLTNWLVECSSLIDLSCMFCTLETSQRERSSLNPPLPRSQR